MLGPVPRVHPERNWGSPRGGPAGRASGQLPLQGGAVLPRGRLGDSLPLEEVVLNETGAFDAAVVAVDDPFAEPEDAHRPWQTAILPLLPAIYVTAERAEAAGRLWFAGYLRSAAGGSDD